MPLSDTDEHYAIVIDNKLDHKYVVQAQFYYTYQA